MEPDRLNAVWSVFEQALEESPEERNRLLDRLCVGDGALRREVEALLAAHQADGLLDHPEQAIPEVRSLSLSGQRVGPYRLVRKLGAGGMGAVYLGERVDEEFEQRVAVKLVQPGLDGEEIGRRFQQERQILARLEHPNVARLLDGGAWEGRPYFVLEYVEGEPIDVYCRSRELRTRELLGLFRQVCDAVHYAHQNLIVHRDLKPSNILVTADGTPKLLDFGIAKMLSPAGGLETATRSRLMTPHYASPEQVQGEAVTTQSDVYSLGVVLYELLTGRSPYRTKSDLPHELARAIVEEEPDLPSVALRRQTGSGSSTVASGVQEAAPLSPRQLAGDLDNIVVKALHKEPRRRYSSAAELSEDLRRYLEGLPVTARPDTLVYRVSKFVGRHRVGVVVTAAAVLILLATTTVAVLQTWRTRAALLEASQQRDVAESVTQFLRETFHAADPYSEEARAFSTEELLDRGARRAIRELGDQPEVRASVQWTLGTVYANIGLTEAAEEQLVQALEVRRRLFGPEHLRVAEVLLTLGTLHLTLGRFDEAESDLRTALRIFVAKLGPDEAILGVTRARLGDLEVRLGHYRQAEEQLQESIRILEVAAPGTDLAASLTRLGALKRTQGEYPEAERLLLRGLELLSHELRPNHPRVLEGERNLGDLYLDWGELDRAEDYYRRALEGARSEQLDAKRLLNSLASVLRKKGDLDEAERLYRQAWELYRAELGEDNPMVTSTLSNLALVLQEKGDLDRAEPLARQVVEVDSRHYGAEHPKLIPELNNLGLLLQEKGDLDEAEALYVRAETLARKTLGDRHPAVAFPLSNRADLAYERGELETAEALFRSALELRREVLPAGHVDLAPSLAGLGRVLVDTGRACEAEPLLRETLAIRLGHLPAEDWHVAWARSDLGACLLACGQVDEAAPLLEDGYAGLEATKGAADRRTARARLWLDRLAAARPAGE